MSSSDPIHTEDDSLVLSSDPNHPANRIPALCALFYTLGWVTGTGGGISILHNNTLYLAPSGVQKERLHPTHLFVLSYPSLAPLRSPPSLKPSACTPLFLAAFTLRNAGACIHTHSQHAVLCTLLTKGEEWSISNIEQIKAIPAGRKGGYLGFFDTVRIPIIENTAREEDLKGAMEAAMKRDEDCCAVLVRRHGVYVWGENADRAKTIAESLDYLFELWVKMVQLGLDPNGPVTDMVDRGSMYT